MLLFFSLQLLAFLSCLCSIAKEKYFALLTLFIAIFDILIFYLSQCFENKIDFSIRNSLKKWVESSPKCFI